LQQSSNAGQKPDDEDGTMKIGIIGTGMVGKALGTKLVSLGHEVKMGSREAGNAEGATWMKSAGKGASQGTFAEAAHFGEMIFLCLRGDVALPVAKDLAKSVPAEQWKGKVVVDVSNPLDFSKGMPPPLIADLQNITSLGEETQKALPSALVVKALNTVNCEVMVNPGILQEETDLFICGNDTGAKDQVREVLRAFGWKKDPVDLGDITNARATEALMPIWMRLFFMYKTPHFNFKIVK
jgi:predicted dinucleotide-binding enzyme